MKKYQKTLTQIGMSRDEATVYLSLLFTGPKNVSEIARETGLYRPSIYRVLSSLRSQEYVILAPSVNKWKRYAISDPSLLQREIEKFEHNASHILHELKNLYQERKDKPTLMLKEGIEEIQSIHSDLVHSLPKGGVYYRYSSSHRNVSEAGKFIPADYHKIQREKELERYVITSESMRKIREGNPMRSVVSIPENFDLFSDNITKLIYGNKVAIIDYDSLSGWIIENTRFALYERKIFTLLFRLLEKNERRSGG